LATLYAFDAGTGAILWSFRVPDGGPIPAVAEHRVFQVSGSRLFALNPANGRVLWTVRGLFTSFDAATGAVRWATTQGGASFFLPPVVGGGMLLDVADHGQIVALRTVDGTRVPLNLSVGTFGSLALVQGNLYVQAGITLFKFALPAG